MSIAVTERGQTMIDVYIKLADAIEEIRKIKQISPVNRALAIAAVNRCEKRKLKKKLIMCKDCAYYDCGFCSISNDETGAPKQVFDDDACDHGKKRIYR